MLRSQQPYFEVVAAFYFQEEKQAIPNELKGQFYLDFMGSLSLAYQDFVSDLALSDTIPEATRSVLRDGLAPLNQIVYPINMGNSPRPLADAEVALLRMAASMLPVEGELSKDDENTIRESIESLRKTIEQTDIPKSVRTALFEIVQLSSNALEHFNIYGARGFKTAFKRMLSELMEIYLKEGPEKVVEQTWWKQGFALVKRFDEVAAKLLKYKPLIDSISKILLPS